MKNFKSQKFFFFLLILLGIAPGLATLFFFYSKNEDLEERSQILERVRCDLLTHALKEEDNIKLHKICKEKAPNYSQLLTPMRFFEGNIEKHSFFKEVEFKQVAPITVPSSVVKELLIALENSKGPQLIVLDFTLDRVPSLDGEDQFKINTKILKREFE